jgi:VIT1/CCC1 family predicted Fe2+/Mn2+ transporter
VPRTDHGHHRERHRAGRAGWLRAAVLGANDGLLSVAALLVGVGAASVDRTEVVVAGLAALVAGALSMAVGEYSSVSSQRDTERADLERERRELLHSPEAERAELAAIYRSRGLSPALADRVADELSDSGDAFAHHARDELGLDPDALSRPAEAAAVSAASFALGAVAPLVVAATVPTSARSPITVLITLLGLVGLGVAAAALGGAPRLRAGVRVLVGGAVALAASMVIGALVGAAV